MPRKELLESIAATIADYRAGEIATPTADHVERWINQFAPMVQDGILAEIDTVLKKTYVTKNGAESYIRDIIKCSKLTGDDQCGFWQGVKFLDIQTAGNSQKDLLRMVNDVLRKECGLTISDCGQEPQSYIYIDDATFTGTRILSDIKQWITSDNNDIKINIVVSVMHSGGQYYSDKKLKEYAASINKNINIKWWYATEYEDRRKYVDSSDVLRPTSLPNDPDTQAYVAGFTHAVTYRKPGNIGAKKLFSSEQGRHLLEQEFFKAGVRIRNMCPNLNVYQRPLGNSVLETPGFGTLLVTFRNCPNNCPLVFWAGDPWYPLFPRKTN
jgi:hypothetical protein